MRSLSEHAARRAASVQRSSATSVRTISDDPAARCVGMLWRVTTSLSGRHEGGQTGWKFTSTSV